MIMVYPKGKKPSTEEVKTKIREYLENWGKVGSETLVDEGFPRGLILKAIKEMEDAGEVETEED